MSYFETITTIDTTPYRPGQLGETRTIGKKTYQYVKFATTATAKDLLYWSDPDNFTVTATVSTLFNEPAGVLQATVSTANTYGWIQVLGEASTKANGTLAAGMQVVADSGTNRVVPELGWVEIALATADTGGGVLAWQSPYSCSVLCDRIVVITTTKSTGVSTTDFGYTAVGATTSSDTLMDGIDTGTAAGTFDNTINHGTNGVGGVVVAAGKWITGSKATGSVAGLVGTAYLHVGGLVGINANDKLRPVGVAQGIVSGGFADINLLLGPKPRNQ